MKLLPKLCSQYVTDSLIDMRHPSSPYKDGEYGCVSGLRILFGEIEHTRN